MVSYNQNFKLSLFCIFILIVPDWKSTFFFYFFFCYILFVSEGDCVRMRSSKPLIPTYVAIIEEMKADSRDVRVRWYYWPEETKKGRRHFHGSKELILSDHFDVQSVDTIEGKCTVHSLKKYMKLDVVGDDDFFCRFNYNSATGALTPDIVQV